LAFSFFSLVIILGGLSVKKLDVSENLSQFYRSGDDEPLDHFIDQNKNQIFFSIAVKDTASNDGQAELAELLSAKLAQTFPKALGNFQFRMDLDPMELYPRLVHDLYAFMDSSDYIYLERYLDSIDISEILRRRKQGMYGINSSVDALILRMDPLNFSGALLARKFDGVFDQFYNASGLFYTADRSRILIRGRLKRSFDDSGLAENLVDRLYAFKTAWDKDHPENEMDFFGPVVIAAANAKQIRRDLKVTLTVAISIIVLILILYYRNGLTVLLFLLPGLFGVSFALTLIYLFKGDISALALSAGAVVFGIIVDYSFHFFTHLRSTGNAFQSRNQLFLPMISGGATTIVAFGTLWFADSGMLNDFGLFATFSLAGSLFFVLAILPYIVAPLENHFLDKRAHFLSRLTQKWRFKNFTLNRAFGVLVIALTLFFFVQSGTLKYESDFSKLNFYPEELKKSETIHQGINPDTDRRLALIAQGETQSEAIRVNHRMYQHLGKIENDFNIKQVQSFGILLLPDEILEQNMLKWKEFWRGYPDIFTEISNRSKALGFTENAFVPFKAWIQEDRPHSALRSYFFESRSFSSLWFQNERGYFLLSSVVLNKAGASEVSREINEIDGAIVIDGAGIVEQFIDAVKNDFDFLVISAGIIVFFAMLALYGSFGLTVITFLPMVIGWIWITGLCATLGIHFNFVNIILATFIFGLGDDFAIFMTDGLANRYLKGREVLTEHKTGIILSSLTTIIGTGALFFAKHPAINSIAAVSVLGIAIILFITLVIQPVLFRALIGTRVANGKPPYTLLGVLHSILGYSFFVIGSLLLTLLSLLIRFIPFISTSNKKKWIRRILSKMAAVQLDSIFTARRRYYDLDRLDFEKPSILIANHSSFFDILALLRLDPRISIMVNQWVYRSPLLGPLVRYLDYVPAFLDMDGKLERTRRALKNGQTLAIFPEGTRSVDGQLHRFHQGAFYLARETGVPLRPIVLQGYGEAMPKNSFYFNTGIMSMKVLPDLTLESEQNENFRSLASSVRRVFEREIGVMEDQANTGYGMYTKLLKAYLYKGPVLEWYFRIKWKHEKKNYDWYNAQLRGHAKMLYDLGCGYGFLSHYLAIRNPEMKLIGVDYDSDKIDIAGNTYLKRQGLDFICSDITTVSIEGADSIILGDVLHYLPDHSAQFKLLDRCVAQLPEGGRIILRDGFADLPNHDWTLRSEKWSTSIIKFNQVRNELVFPLWAELEKWAAKNGCQIIQGPSSENSSNRALVLVKQA
jgi:1-acyl-sn-glycerol-3-phosphate acyltransferase